MGEYSIDIDLLTDLSFRKRRALDDYIIRFADIVGSLFCLVILAPVLPLIALIIRLDSRGSPIFTQERVGKDGAIFRINKFRTMYDGADRLDLQFRKAGEPVVKTVNDNRITRVGEILRRYSIDESLQFINILKGDMSFVGPRPCILEEVNAYNEYQRGRLAGKPGLTGLAQINGRSDLDFDSIVKFDIYYNMNRSIRLYFRILLLTIPCCLFGRSAY